MTAINYTFNTIIDEAGVHATHEKSLSDLID